MTLPFPYSQSRERLSFSSCLGQRAFQGFHGLHNARLFGKSNVRSKVCPSRILQNVLHPPRDNDVAQCAHGSAIQRSHE